MWAAPANTRARRVPPYQLFFMHGIVCLNEILLAMGTNAARNIMPTCLCPCALANANGLNCLPSMGLTPDPLARQFAIGGPCASRDSRQKAARMGALSRQRSSL